MKDIINANKNLDKAITYYNKSIELDAGAADVHNNLGVIYNMMGKKQDAIREWLRAFRINPNLVETKKNLIAVGVIP